MHRPTALLRFLAHAPISEHAPLLKYRHTEVNCNILYRRTSIFNYFSKSSFPVERKCAKKRDYTAGRIHFLTINCN